MSGDFVFVSRRRKATQKVFCEAAIQGFLAANPQTIRPRNTLILCVEMPVLPSEWL